jgi:hypothetical protein
MALLLSIQQPKLARLLLEHWGLGRMWQLKIKKANPPQMTSLDILLLSKCPEICESKTTSAIEDSTSETSPGKRLSYLAGK